MVTRILELDKGVRYMIKMNCEVCRKCSFFDKIDNESILILKSRAFTFKIIQKKTFPVILLHGIIISIIYYEMSNARVRRSINLIYHDCMSQNPASIISKLVPIILTRSIMPFSSKLYVNYQDDKHIYIYYYYQEIRTMCHVIKDVLISNKKIF